MTLFELLQQSRDHRDVMNQLFQKIELSTNDIKIFVAFVVNIKASQNL